MVPVEEDWAKFRLVGKSADVMDSMPRLPGLTLKSMGFPDDHFPRGRFPITSRPVLVEPTLGEVCSATMDAFAASRELILAFPDNHDSSEMRRRFADGMLDLIVDI